MAAVPFLSKKGEARLEAFTTERCPECGAEAKRPFRAGDVLFAASGRCGCGGRMSIDRIFGEPAPPRGGRPAAAAASSSPGRPSAAAAGRSRP